jgi:DNA-binding CsgD family transcriptional regulator
MLNDLQDLLPALLDGAFEEPLWGSFLDRLQVAAQADYASLTFRPPGNPLKEVVHLYAGTAWPAPLNTLYRKQFREQRHDIDPLPYYEMAEGRAYSLDELLMPGEPVHDNYYKNFLVPSGMTTMRLLRVVEASGVNAWITITRRRGDFGDEVNVLLNAIVPYLRSALRGFVAMERERFNASVANDAISRLAFGWVTLGPSAEVLDTDSQGAQLLAQSGILGRNAAGRLTARPRELEREITQAIRALSADSRSRPRAMILSRDPWLDMLLVPTRRRSISAKPDPAVIAYVHGDNWSTADRCDQLAELFVLLPSEARLALALARGLTIAEAASELGITLETARNYSKKIYSKLGARGQSDLVRFVMRSVLAIA